MATHRAIAGVGADFEAYKYNTAIAKLMTLANAVQGAGDAPPGAVAEALQALLAMLSPIAPHICEELWHRLGHDGFVAAADWPEPDESLLVVDTVRVAVQVDGKVRDATTLPAGSPQGDAEEAARALEPVSRHLQGREVVRVVWVPDRLLNFVTGAA